MKIRIIVEEITTDNAEYLLRDRDNAICFAENEYKGKEFLARFLSNLARYVDEHIEKLKSLPAFMRPDVIENINEDEKYHPTEYELQLRETAAAIRNADSFPDAVALLSMFVRKQTGGDDLPEGKFEQVEI